MMTFAASADMVLQNIAGSSVVTNAVGSSSYFPDACTNFTIEAWIKPTAYQTRNDTYSPIFSVIGMDKTGYSRYIFGLRKTKLAMFQSMAPSSSVHNESSSDIQSGVWTHVAVTHTATDVKFYINGSLDATLTGSFLPPVGEYGDSHLTIGGYYSVESLNGNDNYTTARVFQGSLADIRVWTKERTAEEIAADYQTRLRGDEDGLLLYAPFNDANGSVAHDMVSGQSLIAPPTMQFVEDNTLSLSPASAKLIGGGYLASTRTGGNHGASAIITDVDFANKQDGTGPDFTFETWLRVSSQFSEDQWIISKYAESGDTGWIGLDIRAETLKPEVVISGQRFTLDNPIEVDRWYHLAATRTGSSYAIYLDGSPAKSGTCRTTGFSANNAAAPVKLLNAGTNKSFGGDVKEMRIWNVARTAAQIAAYYDKSATGKEEGLIGCWHMDEGYGSKVRNAVTGAEQSVAVGGMGLVRGSYLVLTGQKQSIKTDAKLTTTDFTLEAWVRDDSPTPRLGDNGRGYILSQFQGGKDWVSFCFNAREGDGGLKPGIRISSNWFLPANSSITKGKWFHIAATREGTSIKVYLNGDLSANGTYTASLGVPDANLTFGALDGDNGHVGGIREARAWSYARTQDQIRQTMFGGLVGNEEGLVGWWPFDQDASATRVLNRKSNDLSKSVPAGATWDNDGSPLLATAAEAGETEQSANFGGGWFSVARTGIHVDASDFTFETWVRPDSYPYNEAYLFAQYSEGKNPNRFLMGFHDTGRFGFFIGGTDGSGNAGGWKETDEAIPLGRWTHLAATRQGSTLRLYVNGALAKTFENYTTLSPWSSTHPHDLTLGGIDGAYAYYSTGDDRAYRRNNLSRSFAGAMREVRVWNVARTADEIAENYKRKVRASEAGLVGYWPLDTSGTELVNLRDKTKGYIVAGWERIAPLSLKDPPLGLTITIR
jgi:hypothetical protein